MIIYEMHVTALGPEVSKFLTQDRLLVTFEEGAPPELAEISAMHTHGRLLRPVEVGDSVVIDGKRFRVSAVGTVANQNLENLGHAVFRFDGATEPSLPGSIHLSGQARPHVRVGSRIQFLHQNHGVAKA